MRKLFKKLSAVICAGVLACTAFAMSTFAETKRVYVVDQAISTSTELECEKLLREATSKQGIEFIAIFVADNSVSDYQVQRLARSYSNKYSNCAVMVNNSATRYTYVDIHGKASDRITSAKATKIANDYINPKLKSYDIAGAVKGFIKGVDRYSSFISLGAILIGVVGFVLFFLLTYISIRTKYKFHEKPSTNNYLEGGALEFGVMQDVFVSEHTSRTAISSGGSGGGHGGGHSGGGGHY